MAAHVSAPFLCEIHNFDAKRSPCATSEKEPKNKNNLCVHTFADWYALCDLSTEDGLFIVLAKVMTCSPWVFWISLNAALHLLWVGALLVCQLYQVRKYISFQVGGV